MGQTTEATIPQFFREALLLGLKLLSPYCAESHESKTSNESIDIEVAPPLGVVPANTVSALNRIGWVRLESGAWSLQGDGFSGRFNPGLAELQQLPRL
jgi:hypothetical protein